METPIRILLVDDSTYFLGVAVDYLQLQESFEIAGTANESGEALAQALQLRPDVILLDLNMGEDSGLKLIPLLKKHLPDTKIVVLTMMEGAAYRALALEAGADDFVHKSEIVKSLFPVIFGLTDSSN